MRTFSSRRTKAVVSSLIVAGFFSVFIYSFELMQKNAVNLSGWILLALALVLTLFNGRKKLTYPPLIKSSIWLQFHVYIGWLALLIFFFHTQWQIPNGPLESVLYIIFMLLALSGVLGVFVTRILPKQLASRGSEVIYERIPMFVRQLREQAEQLVLESVGYNNSTILSEFYRQSLESYLSGPSGLTAKIIRRDQEYLQLQSELKALHRYLTEEECDIADQLSAIVETKDDLDFHYVRQGVLKYWLFVHIPLTYSMLLFALVHLVLVQAFSIGLS